MLTKKKKGNEFTVRLTPKEAVKIRKFARSNGLKINLVFKALVHHLDEVDSVHSLDRTGAIRRHAT